MQDYVIYTFGGGEVLWHIMNAVALLFKSENSYFTSVGMLTAGLGLVYSTLRALGSNTIPLFFKDWFVPTLCMTSLFFGLKTSINIIDRVDSDFKYSKVDNIPIGIAAIASLSSNAGKYLTETLETVLTTSDSERFSKVGPMFATRLIHEASKLTIKDPLTRSNIKDFVYQCFQMPYIYSHIAPGKLAAESTTDILSFIETNPHPMLGIYWREVDGRTSFMNCKSCAQRVRELIGIEVNHGMKSLAITLFDSKQDPEAVANHLKKYAHQAWGLLAKGSSHIANTIQQQLILNSYHMASRNKKDELDLGRYDAALIHLEAERGQAVQDTTSLVKSSMSLIQLPNLHSILLALALLFFSIIAPLTFISRGISYLRTWIQVMIWLTTWPVFFTVLNCIGHMFASKALSSSLMGLGEGLTIQTQNGLANTAYSAYCLVMGLQYIISYLSWSLISQGGQAFSQLASSYSQMGESFATKASHEMVDGNVTFDSQTLYNRSLANSQVAQQQLGSAFNYGSRFDDGKVSLLHGTSGTVIAQEHQHHFGTNVSHNDALSQMYTMQSQTALSAANQYETNMQKSINSGSQQLYSFARSMVDSKDINHAFSNSESTHLQKQMQNLMSLSDRFAEENNLNKQVAFDALVGSGIGSGGIGQLFNAKGDFRASSQDTENVSKAHNSELSKQFNDSLNQAVNFALDHKASIGKNFNTQSLDQAQGHFSHAENYANTMSAHLSESKSWSEMANLSRQSGTSTITNANDSVIEKIASQFGGDKAAAAQYLAYHPVVGQYEGRSMIDRSNQNFSSVSSKDSIYQSHANNKQKIQSPSLDHFYDNQINNVRQIDNREKVLDKEMNNMKVKTSQNADQNLNQLNNQHDLIDQKNHNLSKIFDDENSKTMMGRTVRKVGSNLYDWWKK
jgi:conjugal transfer mating pair stabilization protein TraG